MGEFDYRAHDMKSALAVMDKLRPADAVALYRLSVQGLEPSQGHGDTLVMLGLLVPRNLSTRYCEISPLGVAVLEFMPGRGRS